MNNYLNTAKNKKALLILVWVSITLGQVLYKMAERPGELASTLTITVVVIGMLFAFLTLYTKLRQSSWDSSTSAI